MAHDDEEKRILQKFCQKTGPLIDKLSVNSAAEHASATSLSLANVYGHIKKEEFEKILTSYESQQGSPRRKDKPVVCDGVVGSSFAKLLFSRIGFHSLDSTEYLVKALGIRDCNRDSFLGGHSSYSLSKDETLEGIRHNENRHVIRDMMKIAYEHLEKNRFEQARQLIKEALDIDKNSGDALGARGKYYALQKDHRIAVEDYNTALNHNPIDVTTIRRNFSESLFQCGYEFYIKKGYNEAKKLLEQSLIQDPEHMGAQLHLELCKNQLRNSSMFGHEKANTSYRK